VTLIADRYQPLENARPGAPQRARDLQTAQSVLLRNVRLPRDGADEALARAQAAKGIFHPSLVTLFDVLPQPEGRVLLAYEYVPAQTVAQVSGGVPFNPRRAAELLTELGDAVAELHARGIPHGGINQGTVLITMKGKAKLDRVGDPSLNILVDPTVDRDLKALGELLQELVGQPAPGAAGLDVIHAAIDAARDGTLQSAALFAGMLRRQG
jgi:serine/threonine protein kinase